MLYRWPALRAHMGPEFIKLLDWIAAQQVAMADQMDDLGARAGVSSDLAAIEARTSNNMGDS